MTPLVVIESPYAGKSKFPPIALVQRAFNRWYARACMADSLGRGEAPYASHLLYTQRGILNDRLAEDRQQGIEAGLAWGDCAELTAVYTDRGITAGMLLGIQRAKKLGRRVVYRRLFGKRKPRL